MIFGKKWRIERYINSYDEVICGAVNVTYLSQRKAIWREQLNMPTKDKEFVEAFQEYSLEIIKNKLYVHFVSGSQKNKLFQYLNTFQSTENLEHFCDPDLYKTSVEFESRHEFMVMHNVSGPHKNYIMKTIYFRSL